jgi:HK97 family phage major capsid protein
MSLQIALRETQHQLGQAMVQIRELGPKIPAAAAEGKPTAEMQTEFDRRLGDVTNLKAQIERLNRAIEIERELATVTNGVAAGAPGESQAAPGAPAVSAAPKTVEVHKRAFSLYLRGRTDEAKEALSALPPTERHALLSTTGTLGGFLAPEDFRAEIVKNMGGYAVVRTGGARVVPTSSSTLVFPSIAGGTDPYSTGFAGNWRAEGAQGTDGSAPATQDQPTFGQERIPVHVWQPNAVVITRELMEDSVVPLDSLVAQVVAETKAQDEDYAFLRGDGVGRPRGLVDYVGAGISAVNSGAAGDFTYNGLIDLMMNLPAQYRDAGVFICRSTAFGNILKLKDSSQMPLIYGQSVPGTLFGKRVLVSEHMPAVTASAKPLLFGDLRFYCIAERTDIRLQRLEERFAPNVAFLPTARLGGGLLRPAAFVAQNISA